MGNMIKLNTNDNHFKISRSSFYELNCTSSRALYVQDHSRDLSLGNNKFLLYFDDFVLDS